MLFFDMSLDDDIKVAMLSDNAVTYSSWLVDVGRKKANIACRAGCVGRRVIYLWDSTLHTLATNY